MLALEFFSLTIKQNRKKSSFNVNLIAFCVRMLERLCFYYSRHVAKRHYRKDSDSSRETVQRFEENRRPFYNN
jgi:hypothetical protein